jgi:hypothetical protein
VSGKCHISIAARKAEHLEVLLNLGVRKSCNTVVDLRTPARTMLEQTKTFQTSVFHGLEVITEAAVYGASTILKHNRSASDVEISGLSCGFTLTYIIP